MKTCRDCKLEKEDECFSYRDRANGKRRSYCRTCAGVREKKRYEAKRAVIAEYQRAYYREHTQASIAKANRWSRGHTERKREIARSYAKRNREKINQYRRDNPEKLREGKRRRQAIRKSRENDNGQAVTLSEWRSIAEASGGKCLYCATETALVMDHFIPIAYGGGTVMGNLVPVCASCNGRKGDREPEEWIFISFGSQAIERTWRFLHDQIAKEGLPGLR